MYTHYEFARAYRSELTIQTFEFSSDLHLIFELKINIYISVYKFPSLLLFSNAAFDLDSLTFFFIFPATPKASILPDI